ncbi:hypothetical protein M1555_01745 [Patescibacteria group bacterium]|nr:hypothetical protein [Patescibacteria group bacterium]
MDAIDELMCEVLRFGPDLSNARFIQLHQLPQRSEWFTIFCKPDDRQDIQNYAMGLALHYFHGMQRGANQIHVFAETTAEQVAGLLNYMLPTEFADAVVTVQ